MPGLEGLLAGRTLAGRYRIEEVIGRGGYAAVYRAVDERLGRTVAVKVITVVAPDGATREQVRRRFEREARIAAGLDHPNVVTVYDVGTDPELELDFLVMELLRGEDLSGRIARVELFPLPAAVRVLRDAARGIAAGHLGGLIHRDVKPANVFLAEHDRENRFRVCILDFGIARIRDAENSLTRLTHGAAPLSPRYASPEQLRDERDLSPASDVFSLGVIGYELLTGERPFTPDQIRDVSRGETAVPPSFAGVPAEVEPIIRTAMEWEPADRFPGAGEMAEALDAALATLPPDAASARSRVVVVPAVAGPLSAPAAPEPAPAEVVAPAPAEPLLPEVVPDPVEPARVVAPIPLEAAPTEVASQPPEPAEIILRAPVAPTPEAVVPAPLAPIPHAVAPTPVEPMPEVAASAPIERAPAAAAPARPVATPVSTAPRWREPEPAAEKRVRRRVSPALLVGLPLVLAAGAGAWWAMDREPANPPQPARVEVSRPVAVPVPVAGTPPPPSAPDSFGWRAPAGAAPAPAGTAAAPGTVPAPSAAPAPRTAPAAASVPASSAASTPGRANTGGSGAGRPVTTAPALAAASGSASGLARAAERRFEMGDFPGAVAGFRRAVAAAPRNALYRNQLGWALFQSGDLPGAERELVEAIRVDPRRAIAHANLGEVRRLRGDTNRAIASYRRFLELNTDARRERIAREKLRGMGATP
ncbi:MAG TPA: protein kinase [Longimicrobium sp.]|nr:protein kinase [Longimicrobium sp.]